MNVKIPKSTLEYIANLDLADPTYETLAFMDENPLLLAQEGKDAGYVVGGGAISFTSNVSVQHQADVLNSTLLAQLAANKLFDREKQTRAWYNKYHEVLENIAWVVGRFDFAEFEASSANFTMDKVVLEIIATIASGGETEALTTTLNALQSLDPGSKSLTIFDSNGSVGDAGNFQVSTCSEDGRNHVSMSLGTFYFKTTEHHNRFLFWSWSSNSMQFYTGAVSLTLNDVMYSRYRNAITDKLGKKIGQYIDNLNI